MTHPSPPPLPTKATPKRGRNWFVVSIITLGVILGTLLVFGPGALRLTGVIRPFRIPNNAMSPTIQAGDEVLAVGYLWSDPRRGDVIFFRTDEIEDNPHRGTIYVMRLAGLPGDRLSIRYNCLLVNGERVALRNNAGEINYSSPRTARYLKNADDKIVVPKNKYFVLGDNSENSFDSRYWGFVPVNAVLGRAVFRTVPFDRMGKIR